jgi:soluble lytic murein transglycosylase
MKNIVLYISLALTIFLFLNFKQRIGSPTKNPYEDYINTYCFIFAVEPLLVKAIMKKESNLNPDAISPKGAVGLMQIMPKTAIEISSQLNIVNYSDLKLKEIDINIMFGVYYIKKLLNYYDNNLILVLAAYNAGIGNVDNWYIENPDISKKISQIPFKETKRYVRYIMFIYKVYKGVEKLNSLMKD